MNRVQINKKYVDSIFNFGRYWLQSDNEKKVLNFLHEDDNFGIIVKF